MDEGERKVFYEILLGRKEYLESHRQSLAQVIEADHKQSSSFDLVAAWRHEFKSLLERS
jgi:hypothetical protein